MSEKLKPCPFCGSDAKVLMSDGWIIICQNSDLNCNARLPYCPTKNEAIKTWNTRSESDELSEALMLLDEACAEPEWSDAVDEFLSKIKEPPA